MKIYIAIFLVLMNFKLQAMVIYVLNTQIGTTTFKDLLVIEQNHGSLTVPGQFTAQIKNYSSTEEEMKFDIETVENGSPLKASYQLKRKTLTGFMLMGSEKFSIVGEKIYDQ